MMSQWFHISHCIVNIMLCFPQGYFNNTVMYYGGYSNETIPGLLEYNMQLAYFFTIAVYMVLCGLALIFRSVKVSVYSFFLYVHDSFNTRKWILYTMSSQCVSIYMQHGKLIQEKLRSSRPGFRQCMATLMQLGLQHNQWEGRKTAQEQPQSPTQGDSSCSSQEWDICCSETAIYVCNHFKNIYPPIYIFPSNCEILFSFHETCDQNICDWVKIILPLKSLRCSLPLYLLLCKDTLPVPLFVINMLVFAPSVQESLSEKAQRELLTVSETLKHFGVYLGSWLLSTGLAAGCGASIYYLCQYEQQVKQLKTIQNGQA